MDLSLLTSSETAKCTITDPISGKNTDIVIEVYGIYSEGFRTAIKNMPKKPEDNAEFLAAITVGWTGIEKDGKGLPFSSENAVYVYRNVPIINRQVDQFIAETKNFFPKR